MRLKHMSIAAAMLALAGPGATEESKTPPDPSDAARLANCVIVIDGWTWLDRPCQPRIEEGLVVFGGEPKDADVFAYVFMEEGDLLGANASWSGGHGSTHAHTSLGDRLRRSGNCWADEHSRLCIPGRINTAEAGLGR